MRKRNILLGHHGKNGIFYQPCRRFYKEKKFYDFKIAMVFPFVKDFFRELNGASFDGPVKVFYDLQLEFHSLTRLSYKQL